MIQRQEAPLEGISFNIEQARFEPGFFLRDYGTSLAHFRPPSHAVKKKVTNARRRGTK
jgi:hypothetical protein